MILDGKEVQNYYKNKIKEYTKKHPDISFSVICIGENFASSKYVSNKLKFALELGIKSKLINLSENVTKEEVFSTINTLNNDETVHGIILQLPMPSHLDEFSLTQSIVKEKDIDGFNIENIGLTYYNKESLISCTAKGIITMLEYYKIPITGQNVCIAGRSNLVGKILAILFINLGATVTVCNSKTKDIYKLINQSDIFVSAIGRANFFKGEQITNPDLTVVDVGINFTDGKLVGDVEFETVSENVKNISPVPGGVGPLTILELMNNLVVAYKMQIKERNG